MVDIKSNILQNYLTLRKRVHLLFDPNNGGLVGRILDYLLLGLIGLNVLAVIVSTVDQIYNPYSELFYNFELISVFVFSIEYISRIWSAVEKSEYNRIILGRLKFAVQPLVIIDLLAILPFYLVFLSTGVDLRVLRAFRLMRVLRMLKVARYSESVQALKLVINRKRSDLVVALFANVLLLVIASSMMYFIETKVQPEAFPSIPSAMLWGIASLTEISYGTSPPITPLGQFLGAIVAILGIGLFALPASILASGFIEEAGSKSNETGSYCPHCGEKIDGMNDRTEFEHKEH